MPKLYCNAYIFFALTLHKSTLILIESEYENMASLKKLLRDHV